MTCDHARGSAAAAASELHYSSRGNNLRLPLALRRPQVLSPADGDRRAIQRAEEANSGLEEVRGCGRCRISRWERSRVDFTSGRGELSCLRYHHSSRLVILPSGRKEDRLGYPTWSIVYHILLESPVVSVCSRRLCIGRNLPITILCLFSWGRPGSYLSSRRESSSSAEGSSVKGIGATYHTARDEFQGECVRLASLPPGRPAR